MAVEVTDNEQGLSEQKERMPELKLHFETIGWKKRLMSLYVNSLAYVRTEEGINNWQLDDKGVSCPPGCSMYIWMG